MSLFKYLATLFGRTDAPATTTTALPYGWVNRTQRELDSYAASTKALKPTAGVPARRVQADISEICRAVDLTPATMSALYALDARRRVKQVVM